MEGKITPYASGGDGPGCFAGELSAPAVGVTVTVVIVHGVHSCADPASPHMGVVFYGSSPAMWTCLSDAEIPGFQSWSTTHFAVVQFLETTSPVPSINCPPSLADPAATMTTMTAMRAELTRLGPSWFAQAAPARPAA